MAIYLLNSINYSPFETNVAWGERGIVIENKVCGSILWLQRSNDYM